MSQGVESTATGRLIRQRTPSTSTESVSTPSLPSLRGLADQVKGLIEATVAEAYLQQVLSDITFADSPFDAVYISTLQPDALNAADKGRLAAFANVRDISEEISFPEDDLES